MFEAWSATMRTTFNSNALVHSDSKYSRTIAFAKDILRASYNGQSRPTGDGSSGVESDNTFLHENFSYN